MARLSTHVLDISSGQAAAGLRVDLHRLSGDTRVPVASAVTNADGRTPEPLLAAARIERGTYELTFHAGDYFRSRGIALPVHPFLDTIVVRVGLDDEAANYHVPLLLSPYGYSTYRGT
jgi:5-hydroxyisourate hydrolase